jgi:hypothetical protein
VFVCVDQIPRRWEVVTRSVTFTLVELFVEKTLRPPDSASSTSAYSPQPIQVYRLHYIYMKSSANKQSHSVQRADVPIPEPAADNAIFARMQSNLHPLVNRLLAFCNIGTPLLVYPRDPTATFGQDADPFLSGLPANFPIYTIESAEHPIAG